MQYSLLLEEGGDVIHHIIKFANICEPARQIMLLDNKGLLCAVESQRGPDNVTMAR